MGGDNALSCCPFILVDILLLILLLSIDSLYLDCVLFCCSFCSATLYCFAIMC